MVINWSLTQVGLELAKVSPSATYRLEISVLQTIKPILTKHEASRRSTSLITSFDTKFTVFEGDNEIEFIFYFVIPLNSQSILREMVASLGLGL